MFRQSFMRRTSLQFSSKFAQNQQITRRNYAREINPKSVITCSLNGVLTDPKKFNVPVTPEEMAQSSLDAYNAGATCVHIHLRNQNEGMGHIPSWEADVAEACVTAIRNKVPGIIVNLTTGTVGKKGPAGGGELGPTGGPISCIERTKPEIAALNSGSLNYLKATSKGTWAWPPMLFDNPVEKVKFRKEKLTPK